MTMLIRATALGLCPPGHQRALFGPLALTLGPGESLRLSGASGAGKTALLRHLAGLPSPVRGEVIRKPGLRIGFAFAEPRLIPGLSARGNVALPLPRPQTVWLQEALDQLGLGACAALPAPLLSKGQAQRVALLRALAIRPDPVILDEALSGLDPESLARSRDFLERRRAETGFALIETSHDATRFFAPDAPCLKLAP